METCVICGRPKECVHHLIFGMSLRKLCDEDKLYVPMCNDCHNMNWNVQDRVHGNNIAEHLSKMLGQALYERNKVAEGATLDEARQEFMDRYDRSYL